MAWTPPIPEPVWNTASPEVQAAILALAEFYEQHLAKLEARVVDLENRLKLNSTNSSKPPSSDPIGMKRKPPASPSGKKRGGQPGHREAYRALVPPEKIRETTHCKPTACRRCGHELFGDDPNPLISCADVTSPLALSVHWLSRIPQSQRRSPRFRAQPPSEGSSTQPNVSTRRR
jgi:transposase